MSRTQPKRFDPLPSSTGHLELDALVARIALQFPPVVHPMLFAGVKRVVDFQDPAYGDEYLDRMSAILALDEKAGGAARAYALTDKAAKHVAVAMAYDDVIGVADLKTRAKRFQRVRDEVLAEPDQIVYTTEYMHPRAEEIIGLLPAGLGGWIEERPKLVAAIDSRRQQGPARADRHGALVPRALFRLGLRRFRRGTLRHRRERAHLDAWLELARRHIGNYDLSLQILDGRRLVKGYSDTHARGLSKYDRVISALPKLAGRDDGADWLRRLIQAALLDEDGNALDGALKTVETL